MIFYLALTVASGCGKIDKLKITELSSTVLVSPTVNWVNSSQTVSEGAGSVTVGAVLSELRSVDVTIPYAVSGTASIADHDATNATLTIPAGSLSASTIVSITDDTLYEGNETIVLTMGTPTNITAGTRNVHTITITDNDSAPTVNFSTSAQTVSESVGTVTVTASLSAASGLAATVPFVVSGSSTSADHNAANGTITIPAGSTSANYTFTVTDDVLYEPSETVIFTMGTVTNATKGATDTHTITITDNDSAPTVNFSTSAQSVNENVGTVTVTVSLSAASGLAATVPFTVSGTSTSADHNAVDNTITIPAGSTSANYTFTVTDDASTESDETVILTMGAPTGATLGSTTTHTVTIIDDDGATPNVNFATATQSVSESVGTVTVTASLNATSGLAVTVPFTVSGTSTSADHNAANSTITIAAGSTSANYTFTVTDDALSEASETVIFTMGTVTNATKGATDTHTVTITDNDSAPTVNFSASSQTVSESVGTVTVTASLSTASGLAVTVPFTVSGTSTSADHNAANSTITIAAGSTSANYTFTVTDDALYEASETIIFTMGTVTNATKGATDTHTVTITDNDTAPTVNFSASSQTVSESVGTVTVTASLNATSGLAVTVPFIVSGTASGSDHNAANSTLTIAAGSTSVNYTFTVTDDALSEASETIIFTMGTVTNATKGATDTHTVTITDNDTAPTVNFSASSQTVSESVGTVTVTASLNATSGLAVTVPFIVSGTASGSDHNAANSTLTIAAGSTSANYTFTVTDDALYEASETIIFTMGTVTNATKGATDTHTVTITDNDTAPTISIANATAVEGGTITFTVTQSTVSGTNTTVTYTATSGTATLGTDVTGTTSATLTIAASSTSATFSLSSVDNATYSGSKTFSVALSSPSGATLSTSTATGTITDDEAQPSLSIADVTVLENAGSATLTISSTGVSSSPITASWATSNGTATAGADYTSSSGTATIAAGGTSVALTVPILNDTINEANETFTVTLSSPTGATISDNIAVITITDDDNPASVTNITSSQANGAYGISTTIPVQVVFSQAVTVSGSPRLQLATAGSVNEYATYTSGSGSTTLTFNYVVASGDTSSDLNYLSTSSLELNGGTITDGVDNATLTLPGLASAGSLATNKALVIDGIAPTTPGSVDDGSTTGSTSDSPTLTWTASTDSGGTSLSGYEVAIGTTAGGTNVLNWTNIGTGTSYTATGLSLSAATTYYSSVRAKDAAGNRSIAAQGDGWVYQAAPIITQKAYIKASNADASDTFGYSLGLSGNTLIVGADGEDSSDTAITNGSTASSDNSNDFQGAAYIFVLSGSTWSQQAYLKASNGEAGDGFGGAVAISSNTAVVGAPKEASADTTITNGGPASIDNSGLENGAAYVYVRSGSTWSEEAFLKPPYSDTLFHFGQFVAIDGDTIVVGSPNEASNQSTITNGDTLTPNSDAPDAGAAYVFVRTNSTWSHQAYLKSPNGYDSNMFGQNVAISGDTIVVGAIGDSSAQTTITNDSTVPLDKDASASGAAYVFQRTGTTWAQQAYIKASNARANDLFGTVAIQGDTIAVGAPYEDSNQTTITNGTGSSSDGSLYNGGAVYVYKRTGTTWAQEAYLKAPNSTNNYFFGQTVAIDGDVILAGSPSESSNETTITMGSSITADSSSFSSGAVYVFTRTGSTWDMTAYVKASNAQSSDQFGQGLAISGSLFAAGAQAEASSQQTITNGSTASSDNSAGSSGAAYVFQIP